MPYVTFALFARFANTAFHCLEHQVAAADDETNYNMKRQ